MERLKKYLPFLLFSCKRVSEIISQDSAEMIVKDRFILLYHGAICKTCQHYKIQSEILESSISNAIGVQKAGTLSDVKKKEIITHLKEFY